MKNPKSHIGKMVAFDYNFGWIAGRKIILRVEGKIVDHSQDYEIFEVFSTDRQIYRVPVNEPTLGEIIEIKGVRPLEPTGE